MLYEDIIKLKYVAHGWFDAGSDGGCKRYFLTFMTFGLVDLSITEHFRKGRYSRGWDHKFASVNKQTKKINGLVCAN